MKKRPESFPLRAKNTFSAVPPEFPSGHSKAVTGLTRTSLLTFQEASSGATIRFFPCALAPTGHSLEGYGNETSPSMQLSINYHIFPKLSTGFLAAGPPKQKIHHCLLDGEKIFLYNGNKSTCKELMNLKLSLIVPCYNEAENVAAFQDAVISAFQGCGYDYEIVFIDDGSRDATFHNLKKLYADQRCPVKVISFSRNFGKESGLYAGLQYASGQYLSLIDADLQQRPEIVREMVKILDEQPEYDVVAAYQDRRSEGKVLSFFKKSFYYIINKLSDVTLQPDASDFRTFRRSVRDSILELVEYHRFSKGIFAWVGYSTCFIPYTACQRASGSSKWNFWKLTEYAVEGIIGYSTAPLRLATVLGSFSGVAAILYLIWVILEKLIRGIDVPGYATIIVLILFFASMQLFCIGIIGEYVGRTFEQTKNRPIYIAKEILDYEKP